MQSNVKIPVAIQIRVDDVAWHNGADERFKQRPSRSGLPRRHHPLDYKILHEIGKALDMKIYNDWGFGKKIISFADPCGCLGTPAQNTRYANILREYGILY